MNALKKRSPRPPDGRQRRAQRRPVSDPETQHRIENPYLPADRDRSAVIEAVQGQLTATKERALFDYLVERIEGRSDEELVAKFQFRNSETARQARHALRIRLREIAVNDAVRVQKWLCTIPERRQWVKFALNTSPTMLFWETHLKSGRDIVIVCNDLMFFVDRDKEFSIRFFDVNPDYKADNRAALAALHAAHDEVDTDGLLPTYLYVLAPEVMASDKLAAWFGDRPRNVQVARRFSRTLGADEVFTFAPILLGCMRTSPLIQRVLPAKDQQGFAFRISENDANVVQVFSKDSALKDKLARLAAPIEEAADHYQIQMLNKTGYWYGLVYRLPLRRGAVPATIIMSTAAPVIEKIAEALVNDARLKEMFPQIVHSAGDELPERFACLFAMAVNTDVDSLGNDVMLVASEPRVG